MGGWTHKDEPHPGTTHSPIESSSPAFPLGKTTMPHSTEDIAKALGHKRTKDAPISSKDLCGTGSTLLNLAFSGRPFGGVPKGKIVLIVGDSDSGKSWLSMNLLAEAANTKSFNDYDLIYNNSEDGALENVEAFFGTKAQKRIEFTESEFIDDFYNDILARLEEDKKFIYVLDSETVLEARQDFKKDKENRALAKKGKDTKGDYGVLKAKLNSQNLRKIRSRLKRHGSILVLLTQTRDNIAAIGPGDKKTRGGGRALKFYCALELWTSVRMNLTKTVKGKPRQLGVLARCQVKKNHVTGKKRECLVPIYHSMGIDDIGACIDYLVDEGHWSMRKKVVKAPEFDFDGKRDKLIRHIEENDCERELRLLVAQVWREIEDACAVRRKQRYV